MVHTNIEVETPKHIRIRKQNGNRYVYLVTGRKGDSKGNEKDVTALIGRESRKGFMNPNDKYFRMFPDSGTMSDVLEPSSFDTQSRIGSVAAIYGIAEKTGLKSCLDLAFGKDAPLILSLASYYLIARDSAAMLYSDFMFDHYGKADTIASEATISRLFNVSMSRDKVDSFRSAFLKHCFTNSDKTKKRVYVDIDSTNFNVSSAGCDSAEYGKAKDDEGLPQINMAYFHDRQSGMPIFYDSFYGSITDLSHCITGIKSFFDNLNISKKNVRYDFILDRGYFSETNIGYLSDSGVSFAVMGKTCDMYRNYLDANRALIRSSASLISMGLYGTRVQGKAFKGANADDYYIYLYFDSTKETEEKCGIEAKLIDAKKALEGKKKDRNGSLRRTYGKYLCIETRGKEETIRKVTVNSGSVDSMLKDAGYFWIVSTMKMEPDEMLRAYRERDEIEKCFRIVKSESDLNKTYAQNDNALYAKLLMGFITAVLKAEFTFRTRELSRRKGNLSVQKMLMALDKIIMYKVSEHYSMKYAYTSLQQEIFNALSVEKSSIEAIVTDWNSHLKK